MIDCITFELHSVFALQRKKQKWWWTNASVKRRDRHGWRTCSIISREEDSWSTKLYLDVSSFCCPSGGLKMGETQSFLNVILIPFLFFKYWNLNLISVSTSTGAVWVCLPTTLICFFLSK